MTPRTETGRLLLAQLGPGFSSAPSWVERRILAIEDEAREMALRPYAALASGEGFDEELYLTDPIYHATVYRMLNGREQ